MFPTAGPLGFPIGTASRMLVVKVDLRLKRSMSATGSIPDMMTLTGAHEVLSAVTGRRG